MGGVSQGIVRGIKIASVGLLAYYFASTCSKAVFGEELNTSSQIKENRLPFTYESSQHNHMNPIQRSSFHETLVRDCYRNIER